ncbi:MAG: HEPN domain-containing protein [Chloroflexota bacterium]
MSDLQHRLGSLVVEHPVILGMTADGKAVSLVGAIETGGQMNLFAPEAGDTIITAPHAYIGGHFRREADAKFRRMALKISLLDSWFPPPLIDRRTDLWHGKLRRSVLAFEPAQNVGAKMPFGTLTFGHDFEATGNLRTEAHLTQSAALVATTDRQQPLEWWLTTVVKPLRFLLSISTELPISVETIRLRPWITKTDGEVEVIWANDLPAQDRPELHQAQMLLGYEDLAGRFEQALRAWFIAVEELEEILDQFFATYHTARSFVETRFTMTVSAAEAYHRERIGGTDAPADVHRGRMAQARSGVDERHLEWLNQRLNNEPTLVRRIVELCELVPAVAKLMIGDDAKAFARQLRDARNFRTHLDPRRRSATERLHLVRLTSQLAVILEAAILHRELGFEPTDIAQRVVRASRLRRLAIQAGRSAVTNSS